jgi:hypothetical protein
MDFDHRRVLRPTVSWINGDVETFNEGYFEDDVSIVGTLLLLLVLLLLFDCSVFENIVSHTSFVFFKLANVGEFFVRPFSGTEGMLELELELAAERD